MRRTLLLYGVCALLTGCGAAGNRSTPTANVSGSATAGRGAGGIPSSLLAGVRPIGLGPRFQPPVTGSVAGSCRAELGPRLQAHIELFGANRVVLLAAGIGTRKPRRITDGRVTSARCFGPAVTLDPTGVVYFRAGRTITVGDVFAAWGQPLGPRRIASFTGGRVRVFVNGRRSSLSPRSVPLTQDAEIVLEVGPSVPPHTHFTFPTPPPATLR